MTSADYLRSITSASPHFSPRKLGQVASRIEQMESTLKDIQLLVPYLTPTLAASIANALEDPLNDVPEVPLVP